MIRPRKPIPLDPSRPIPPGLEWYVLTTAPKREHHVAHWLEGQGWRTLVPLATVWKIRDKRRGYNKRTSRVRMQVPVIPRIVMVGFATTPPWLTIRENWHIIGVLGDAGAPIPMRRGEAERLQIASQPLLNAPATQPLKIGGRASIAAPGPFSGHIVEIKELTGKWATVIQSWFGGEVTVKIATDDLEAA